MLQPLLDLIEQLRDGLLTEQEFWAKVLTLSIAQYDAYTAADVKDMTTQL